MPGPMKKPNFIKVLEGSKGADRSGKRYYQPEVKAPMCPAWLDDFAKDEWKRIVPELVAAGLVANIDRAALSVYCQAYSEYKLATKTLRREGRTYKTESGYFQQHPSVVIQNKAASIIKSFATEFGLTPAARGRVRLPKGKRSKGEDLD